MCVCVCCVNSDSEFVSYSDETRQALLEWNRHDDEADRFCMHDGNLAEQRHLHRNRAIIIHCLSEICLYLTLESFFYFFILRTSVRIPVKK